MTYGKRDPRVKLRQELNTVNEQLKNKGLNRQQKNYLKKQKDKLEGAINNLTQRKNRTGTFDSAGLGGKPETPPPTVKKAQVKVDPKNQPKPRN